MQVETENVAVSAIICTRDRGALLVDAVSSILASAHESFELIVVDQSVDDVTKNSIDPFLRDVRLRYVPSQTTGLGMARRVGMDAARGEILAFADDDCVLPANWLQVVDQVFADHPRVAVVFCNVRGGDHDRTQGFVPDYVRSKDACAKSIWEKNAVRGIGAGMAVRKSAIVQIGGFDAALGAGGRFPSCEDGDIAIRALLNGWHVYETTATTVVHHGFRSWEEGRALTRRDWIGIGAAYVKPLKCGHFSVLSVIAHEAFAVALLASFRGLREKHRPVGLWRFIYFWVGFLRGMFTPVDCRTMLYRPDENLGRHPHP